MGDAHPGAPLQTAHSVVNLLYTARCVRRLGDGFAVVILPAYLTAIGLSPVQIGFVAAASLLGTAALTLLVGLSAPRHDLRNMLLLGAGPDGPHRRGVADLGKPDLDRGRDVRRDHQPGDIGVLVPLEHASLARGVTDRDRTRTFARYSLIGALSMAAGSLMAGLSDVLVTAGFGPQTAFRLMFYLYAALGVLAAALYLRLPRAHVEPSRPDRPPRAFAIRRLQACRAVQLGRLRRRVHCPVVARALAVREIRSVGVGCEPCSSSGRVS